MGRSSDEQPRYPIGTVSRRTGLSPHLLRAWERRYGAVEPARGNAGERLYSEADIARFRLLHWLSRAGHPIGRIARLPTPELEALLPEEAETRPPPAAPAEPPPSAERYLAVALSAAAALDAPRLQATLTRAAVSLSSFDFSEHLLLPLLYRIGELWQVGEVCPAHEHLVSVQVSRVLGWVADAVSVPAGAPTAVAGTPAGQRHEFGALLAALVAAEEGWRVVYLGVDLPAADIATAVEVSGAQAVLISAVMPGTGDDLPTEIREIRGRIGGEPHILVGGSGAAAVSMELEMAGASWIPDFAGLRVHLRTLNQEGDVR